MKLNPCPECGGVSAHQPFDDVLLLRCASCGFTIGADDLHNCHQNWNRRARTLTEVMGPDFPWHPNMTDAERREIIGCDDDLFERLQWLPKEHP